MTRTSPNTALQRTRVRPAGGRSPLSFKTFGGRRSWHSGSQAGFTSCRRIEGAAPLTACRGSRSDLTAPPAIAEPPAKQKQNDQDDDDESRC
jgi:hypothetical protein